MPSSAIRPELADYILPPEEMPDRLIRYASHKMKGFLSEKAVAAGKVPDTLQKLFILLRNRTGHDFSQYKQNTISRRVERRITVSQLDSLPTTSGCCRKNPREIESLFRELLIGVDDVLQRSRIVCEIENRAAGARQGENRRTVR